jgi:hypothetical protein
VQIKSRLSFLFLGMFQNEFSAFCFSALASHHLSQGFHQAGLRSRAQGCSDDEREREREREIYIEHELLILLLLSIITAYPDHIAIAV